MVCPGYWQGLFDIDLRRDSARDEPQHGDGFPVDGKAVADRPSVAFDTGIVDFVLALRGDRADVIPLFAPLALPLRIGLIGNHFEGHAEHFGDFLGEPALRVEIVAGGLGGYLRFTALKIVL
jgi:hypothetical protein